MVMGWNFSIHALYSGIFQSWNGVHVGSDTQFPLYVLKLNVKREEKHMETSYDFLKQLSTTVT